MKLPRVFASICDKRLPLQIETNEAKTLERYFEAERVVLPAADPGSGHVHAEGRTCASGAESQELVGSSIRDRRKASIRFSSAQGQSSKSCLLPAEIRWRGGRSFHIYLRQGTTVVFWQEKDLCCALISDADPEEAIRLAQASAKV